MRKSINMTGGPLAGGILAFSIPLILSNLLQVLFNMSDIAVVGQFAGSHALGSVGSCTILVTLTTGLPLGLGGGVNALVARCVGARDSQRVRESVDSAFAVALIYGVLELIAAELAIPALLHALGTKEALMDGALIYMKVYALGVPALMLYNFGNGVLSANGDAKRPLYYLAGSGILNIGLNLLFVVVFQLSVLGVALASVISQYVSCILILLRLFTCKEEYGLSFKTLHPTRAAVRDVLVLGIPAGLQNSIFAVANLFIQSAVNTFDTVMVEGNSAAANYDALIYDMMAGFYSACTTFIGQNYGARQRKRVMGSYLITMGYAFASAAVAGVCLRFFGTAALRVFTSDGAVIEAGLKRLNIMAFSYCVSAFMDCTIAASRGLGKTIVPTIVVILGSCVFRIIWVYTIFARYHTIFSLYSLYVCSWSITAALEILYFLKTYRRTFAAD